MPYDAKINRYWADFAEYVKATTPRTPLTQAHHLGFLIVARHKAAAKSQAVLKAAHRLSREGNRKVSLGSELETTYSFRVGLEPII